MATVAPRTPDAVARPPRVLVPLIREALTAGQLAGLTHYRAAGALLLEARASLRNPREWGAWLTENFDLSRMTATRYMRFAEQGERSARTLSEATDRTPRDNHQPSWHAPITATLNGLATERLAAEARTRAEEARLERELCEQIISIGYRVLSTRLHPDKRGGSNEAMARLSRARARLQGAL